MLKRIKNESGYSLVEVMVAIMLLAIAIIPMVGMFDAGLRAAVLGGNYDTARTFANEKLEETKALSFSEVLTRYPEGTITPCTPASLADSPITSCSVATQYMRLGSGTDLEEVNTHETAMLRITVTVRWSGGSFQTTGVIAK